MHFLCPDIQTDTSGKQVKYEIQNPHHSNNKIIIPSTKMPPPHPSWYQQTYSSLLSVVALTSLITRHASELAETARFIREIEAEEQQSQALSFVDVDPYDDDGDGVDNRSDDDSVASDASLGVHLNRGSSTTCLKCF